MLVLLQDRTTHLLVMCEWMAIG